MSIKVALEHRTTYDFAHPVAVAPHVVRLRPAPHSRTPIEAYSLTVKPENHFLNWQQDPFGNWLARLVFPEKVKTLDITVGLVADMMVINPFDFFIEEYAEHFPFAYAPELEADLTPYLAPVDDAAKADAWRRGLDLVGAGDDPIATIDFLVALNQAVNGRLAYSLRMETGFQSPDTTLDRGVGSCRDFAWLLVSLLRQFGLAARFVSGYSIQLKPDLEPLEGPGFVGEGDITDLHAWCEVFIPGAGWIGLDATSGMFTGEGHIPLSATPHPSSAAPIEGATEPVEVTFSFSNEVVRIHEDPRVTKPYTDEAWARIDALGEAVDARLAKSDVRLTMGGEPTFVSLDDQVSAQWNTAADGPDKRRLAGDLADRLQAVYAKGGVVHRGQGKWYPGEPLPRWNIALQWRTDGRPLWDDPTLLDDPWEKADSTDAAAGRAEALARALTSLLGLPEGQLLPAYEDPLALLAAEVRQPWGERPGKELDEITADSLKEIDGDVATPTGWVLPIVVGTTWASPAWSFRRGRLVLLPGTSAVGLRLPLDAISWHDPEYAGEPSYLEAGEPLPAGDDALPTVAVVPADGAPTTALAIEAREGHVFVFLPPTDRLEDYATLLHAIERAATEAGTSLVVEGYGPPPDARLTQLVVTPDPGVIEVNVQPTSSWAEQRELTATLYEEARQARLSTEKFDLDGLHTGTGGGNHITLGGTTPADSPLLRRPDLLASLITYWQRHPSLSYLFSGRFIGPTSQAPRFDEGRPEAVYEMEIAQRELARLTAEQEELGLEPRPWLVDRLFRHLLTDLTGNTHRSEFCIDKLYSPDSSRGRLGLLELRGFEMPPHPQMALLQSLLVRSLVAMFWEKPLSAPLVRWGTTLHEDFLLPQGAIRDIGEVVADLRAAGIGFEESWLDPFTEFRFPRIGLTRVAGVELELRQAIEPWHVLGEEATGSGTARYVDSSVERIQVRVTGLDPHRHLVTCQGVPLPLTATETPGEFYAGVRYKAWAPWSALHPTIDVHSPLHVDIVDAVSEVSLGGATYHVVHPGGRSYDTPPVNANEAEARRAGRFEARGFTAGRLDVAAMRERGRRAASAEYPHILDLRRS
ncbi:MAG: transglutaminase family protein [Nocardioides sp.]|uniref:transglutaminase family protein n=1 Tax=Nocardioides sp. TaxID=35761 RepID=UPI0039E4503F